MKLFFRQYQPSLAKKILEVELNPLQYRDLPIQQLIFLSIVTETELHRIIHELKINYNG